MQIEQEIKQAAIEQRLFNLRTRCFELQMDLAAYEANGDIQGADQTKKLIESCEKSYNAINNMNTE